MRPVLTSALCEFGLTSLCRSRRLDSWPKRAILAVTLVCYSISVVNLACDVKALENVTNQFISHLLAPGANSANDAAAQLASQVNNLGVVNEITGKYNVRERCLFYIMSYLNLLLRLSLVTVLLYGDRLLYGISLRASLPPPLLLTLLFSVCSSQSSFRASFITFGRIRDRNCKHLVFGRSRSLIYIILSSSPR